MQYKTLCLPIKEEKILLGIKKRGFGKGKLNGFGGGIDQSETIEKAAIRELREEVDLETDLNSIEKVGELTFTFPAAKEKNWDQIVYVFLVKNWRGSPKESEEMGFEWFNKQNIPFDRMWDADKYWIPLVLNEKRIRASFVFNNDNETIKTKKIYELP